MRDEENVSAEQPPEKEDTRLQDANEVARGASRDQASPGEGSKAPGRLSSVCRATLPRAARIRKRREFLEIYDSGLRVSGSLMVLFVRPTEHGCARLGITATRKVGGAVTRNRLRRLVREAFRRERRGMESWDLVVNVRIRARAESFEAMKREFSSLVRRARRRLRDRDARSGS